MSSKKKFYATKNHDYFSLPRKDIIQCVPFGKNKVLEIGCGNGATLLELRKTGRSSEIVGVDISCKSIPLDNFISGDIEKIFLPYPEEYFDIIICADVLEHLIDPWQTLEKITLYLKKEGLLISSIPNIREIKTMFHIFFRGDFRYQNQGILDKTHLRFFCKKNIIELVEGANLKILDIQNIYGKIKGLLNLCTLGIFKDFFVAQYIVISKKNYNNHIES